MRQFFTIFLLASLLVGLAANDKKGKDVWKKEHFKKVDTNSDGKISKEEWQKFHEAKFTELDADKDGMISEDEMNTFHKEKMKEHKDHKDHKGHNE